MRALLLYPERPSYPVQQRGLVPDPKCTRCELHKGAKVTCAGHQLVQDGEGPTVMLLLPSLYVSDSGAPLRDSARSRFLRPLIPKGRRVIVATAARCSHDEPQPQHMKACVPFNAHSIAHEHVGRVLAFGQGACDALLGNAPPIDSARGGYVFVGDMPVFLLDDVSAALRNRFAAQALAADVRRAFEVAPQPPPTTSWREVASPDDARAACVELARAPWFAFDCETFGRAFDIGFKVLCIAAVAAGSDDAFVWTEAALADPATRAPLMELLADPDVEKCGQNVLFDAVAVRAAFGVEVRGCVRDTMLRRAMLNTEALTRLEVQQALVGMYGDKADMNASVAAAEGRVRAAAHRALTGERGLFSDPEDIAMRGVNAQHALDNPKSYAYALAPRPLLHRYCALDVVSTARLEARHERTMSAPALVGVRRVWTDVMSRATDAVAQVTAWGVCVSREALMALRAYLNITVQQRADRLRVGGITDPGSAPHVAEVLYDKLKLSAKYGTAGGKRSTGAEALEELEGKHPIVADLLEWRRLDKLRGTYAEGLLRQVTPDGRIHVDFRITGARTGRMSAGGGLHGLPRPENEEARMVRDCIVAAEGNLLVELDLSQAELRALAGLSGDPEMTATFVRGEDIHGRSAAMIAPQVWRITPEQVTPRHRSVAKIINLSIVYRRGDMALAKQLTAESKMGQTFTKKQAGAIKAAIIGGFKVADAWMNDQLAYARQHGVARTYWHGEHGRRRLLWDVAAQGEDEETRGLRGNAERAAQNTPVQGTTSDLLLFALIEAVDWLKRSANVRAMLVLTVHDSLLFEVREDDVPLLVRTVKAIMEAHNIGQVPMVADVKVGRSAGALKKYP